MSTIRQRTGLAAILGLFAALLTSAPLLASATRVHYPDQQNTLFTVDTPAGWTLTPQGEEDAEDYFYVSGPNGEELAFRTIDGSDIEAAIEAHVAYLTEHFSNLKLGEAVPTSINGMEAVILPAVGTDEEGSVRDLGSGWFKISANTLGELWYNVDQSNPAGKNAASAVLNSLKGR